MKAKDFVISHYPDAECRALYLGTYTGFCQAIYLDGTKIIDMFNDYFGIPQRTEFQAWSYAKKLIIEQIKTKK